MTINNKIRTPQVVLIVGLSWASNDITFGLKKLHLAVRALPKNTQKYQKLTKNIQRHLKVPEKI